jgi:anhydro-N-acetylmuramic acid kinase
MTLYAGLISGTSMDGVESVLLDIARGRHEVRAALHLDYPDALGRKLRAVVADPSACDLDQYGTLDAEVGDVFADCADRLLTKAGIDASQVRAIGSHGQTILHRPRPPVRFTLQIGDPNRIAERLGIDVVADFRRRDMAAGGEGAPLLPAFHAAAFAAPGEARVVANIGGIGNITVLGADGSVKGFDTGPGNCLMDLWATEHLGRPYDEDGRMAASAPASPALLQRLLAEPYFAAPAPKSTGRELFHRAWLQPRLEGLDLPAAVVQSTLCELTATSIAAAILHLAAARPTQLLVCGGGACNGELMRRLASRMPGTRVSSTAQHGVEPEHVEAAGFAWLAHAFLEGSAGNIVSVTGARGPRPLGALYRGSVTSP